MPKLSKSKSEQQDAIARGLLKYAQGQYDLNVKQLAAVLGCSERTYRNRYNSPETLTLRELRRLVSKGYIKREEIINIV